MIGVGRALFQHLILLTYFSLLISQANRSTDLKFM